MELTSTHELAIEDRSGRGGTVRFVCTANPEGEILSFEEHDQYQGGPIRVPADIEPQALLIERVMARSHTDEQDLFRVSDFLLGITKRADSLRRYEGLVGSLVPKMRRSQTPVPGFITGLSGKDSILSFLIVYDAAVRMGLGERVLGIHYVSKRNRGSGWFEADAIPWLRERCPEATILVETPLGGNQDQQRWADLHLRALNTIETREDGEIVARSLPAGRNYWVVSGTNLTEHELGKYSTMSRDASVAPIRTVWNGAALDMCIALGVPASVIEHAQLPDCFCGRDEIAAANIHLIDAILKHDFRVRDHDPDLLDQMIAYVRDLKRENGFKARTPYML